MANPNSVKKKRNKTKEDFNICLLTYSDIQSLKRNSKDLGKGNVLVGTRHVRTSKFCQESLSFSEIKAIKKFAKENNKQDVSLKFSRNSGIGVTVEAFVTGLTVDTVVNVTDYDNW